MRLDELAADVTRRAGRALQGVVEFVHDAQGLRVCTFERTELLAQEVVHLRDVHGEQCEVYSVCGGDQCMVEQVVEQVMPEPPPISVTCSNSFALCVKWRV